MCMWSTDAQQNSKMRVLPWAFKNMVKEQFMGVCARCAPEYSSLQNSSLLPPHSAHNVSSNCQNSSGIHTKGWCAESFSQLFPSLGLTQICDPGFWTSAVEMPRSHKGTGQGCIEGGPTSPCPLHGSKPKHPGRCVERHCLAARGNCNPATAVVSSCAMLLSWLSKPQCKCQNPLSHW